MKKSVLWMIGGLALAGSVLAQEAKPPAMLVKDKEGVSSPLRVDEVDVQVKVAGNVAETVMTIRFRNDTNRILEGELVFPLGEGRTVSRYALEVNGVMREGVSIPKKRGRAVFESVVRQQIDPGLLEWTKGNNFRTRVYPIPKQGTKSVRVGYEEELREANGEYLYRLPLDFKEAVDRFRLKVEVARPAEEEGKIEVEGGLKLKRRAANAWIVEADEKNYRAKEALKVKIPREEAPTTIVEKHDGERFFYVLDRAEVPGDKKYRAKPKAIHLVWDASNSGGKREVKKELALLDRYFKWVGNATVELRWLRNDLENGGSFEVKGGVWDELRKSLEAVRYDGGTRLDILDFRKSKSEAVLFVSDGVSTLGKGELKVGEVPVLAIHAAQGAEHGVLRAAAVKSSGVYVNLAAVGVDEGLVALTEHRFSLLRVEVEGKDGAGAEEIYPSLAQPVTGAMGVAGKLKTDDPVTVALHYGWGKEGSVVRRIAVDPSKHASLLGRAPRLWAQKKLQELEMDAKRNRVEIIELAKGEGLVTRFTSLIVLDRIEDYVEHRIVPPEPKMRKKYERMLKEWGDPDEPDPEHLKETLVMWKERCGWHAKKFPGLEEIVFERLMKVQPAMEELRRDLKELGVPKDDEGKKEAQEARKILADYDAIREQAKRLQETARTARNKEWEAGTAKLVDSVQDLFTTMLDLSGRLDDGEGGADPFGGDDTGAVRLRMRLPGGGDADGGGAADPFSAPNAPAAVPSRGAGEERFDPPELPNQVGGGAGGLGGAAGAFPMTPATPTANFEKEGSAEAGIALAKWDPKTPYLAAMKKAGKDEDHEMIYFEWKAKHENSSAFYLDVADFFLERKEKKLALRILTNVAEMNLESVQLLRILGHRLDQLGELELAEMVFREVKELRGDEPQSWRDLALVLEKRGKPQEALDLMWMVVSNYWERFDGIQMIVLMEMNALLARKGTDLDLSAIDERFVKNLDCDLRIVLTWDADNTDIDLWVDGPAGERCDYSHNRTRTGGRMSEDFVEGYGPEEFLLRRALRGDYKVRANFYGNRQQVLAGATTVQAVFITNWGRPDEKREAVTLRLKGAEEVVEIGTTQFQEKKE